MKNILKISFLFFTSALVLTSCDSLVEEINYQDDPNTVGTVPTVNLISQAELTATYLTESDASRFAGIGSNYIVGSANQWVAFDSYNFSADEFNRLWENIYVEGLRQARDAKGQATIEGDDDAIATASFIEALFLGELAAMFGDVPDNEAIAGILNPAYDSQSSVFNHVQELLDTAISVGSGSTIYITDANGGTQSTSNLGTLAHSLKARYYLIAKDYPNALIQAQSGISNEGGDLYATHSTNNGAINLWWTFTNVSRPGDTTPKGGYLQELIRPGGSATRLLNTPGDEQRTDFYFRGNENYNSQEGGIFQQDASLPIIGWHETQFILAEAAYRMDNENLARTTLNNVRTALAAQFSGDFPDSTASGNDLLLHILEEKYVTIYPSAQTWHDLRRTNNAINIDVKSGTVLPQRFLYPQTEVDSNDNVPSPLPTTFTATPINQ